MGDSSNKTSFLGKIPDTFSEFTRNILKKEATKTIFTSLWCALAGLILGFIILLCINPNNACEGILNTLKNFFVFSNPETRLRYFGQTLAKTAPLIMVSLSICFSFKCGLFNIGASGQYSIAALFVTFGALAWKLPWWFIIILAMVFGALWAGLCGLLKALFNVNEVISGIMLNWLALYLVNPLMQGSPDVWNSSSAMAKYITPTITDAAGQSITNPSFLPNIGLDKVFGNNSICGIAMVFAILVVAIIYVILERTTFGFQVKCTGLNASASKYAGMKHKQNIIIVMCISGALAGLCASFNIQNGFACWTLSSTVPTVGFDGISAAFLGGLNPIGAVFSSYFITHIIEGGSMITDLGYAPQVANIMTAAIIYLSGFVPFIKTLVTRYDLKMLFKKKAKEESAKQGGNI